MLHADTARLVGLATMDEGPPHAAITAGELEGQVEPQLDEHVTARQAREAPVHATGVERGSMEY
eukprot:scaffold45579_cov67-Phaeocystis_antarctica.AAC.4